MALTTQEIADKLGVPRDTAYKLVSFLEDTQLITLAGVRPAPTGKGKGAKEFVVPDDCGAKLAEMVGRLT